MNGQSNPLTWLVAHRGWPDRHPENSLEGMRAVLCAGARFVEFDVQVTADHRPVVIHDDDLTRLSGRADRVTQLTLAQLEGIALSTRPGEQAHVPTLEAMLELIGQYPGVTAFVELKRQSISTHGRRRSVELVMERLGAAPGRFVFLSFKWRAVRLAQRLGARQTGWAFRPWTPLARLLALRLKPDFLFVRADRVPDQPQPFWRGPWQWVIYGVDRLTTAAELKERGADLIEVDDLPGMLEASGAGHES